MLDTIEAIAREAGALAMRHFSGSALQVDSKSHLDLVTQADREVEELVFARLRSAFPDDGIFGEEGGDTKGTSGRTWVVDPIDGTFNFVRGSDQWSVSIGLYDGRPSFGALYLPAQDKFVIGGNGIPARMNGVTLRSLAPVDPSRAAAAVGFNTAAPVPQRLELLRYLLEDAAMVFRHSGCGTVSLLDVALGRVDGYVGIGESSWDVMAALAILEQLGATTSVDWQAVGLHDKLTLACGTPEFVNALSPLVPFGQVFQTATANRAFSAT